MFERFTQDARTAVVLAQELARELHADRIGAEHVLAGAVRSEGSVASRALSCLGAEPSAVAAAVRRRSSTGLDPDALAALGIDLDAVRARAERLFGVGALDRPAPGRGGRRGNHTPFDPSAKKLLEVALREAVAAGHRRIDTGHLLLAVVRLDDTQAHQVLLGLGLGADEVRAAVRRTWAEPDDGPTRVLVG
ncbi:MAG: hypothetical protein B7X40_05215 [Cellulomonas sp. 14-74-6]|nr:MAG: hypothetical protein B7X40_05215 [Cellulomonas sp. 14-74-6]